MNKWEDYKSAAKDIPHAVLFSPAYIRGLIQAAEEEIETAYAKLVQCKADKDNLKKEITHLKEKIEVINNEPTLELLEAKAEITRLREALEIGIKWMEWWLNEYECECEYAHTCGRTERYEELLKMREAIKENSDE